MGPAWAYWAFPTERFCGILQRHVKNRRYPFASLDTFAVASARLSHIGVRFDIAQLLSLKPVPNVAVRGELRLHNCVYYEYLAGTRINIYVVIADPTCALLPPHQPLGTITDAKLLRRIAVCLTTRFGIHYSAAKRLVSSENVEAYSKVRRLDSEGGDTMSASSLVRQTRDRRDATWIRVRYVLLSWTPVSDLLLV